MSLDKIYKQLFTPTVELKSEVIELSLVSDIESDVLANGKSSDLARTQIRQAQDLLSKAYDNYVNIEKRNQSISKNSDKFKATIKELGIVPTDQFQKNIVADLYVDKNISQKINSVKSGISSLKGTGETL